MISILKTDDISYLKDICRLEELCFGSQRWSDKSVKDDILNDKTIWVLAFSEDVPVGYACARVIFTEGEINRVAVAPQYRSRGIGGMLLKKLADECCLKACSMLYLEVRESNTPARKLYESAGFKECGIRKKYYKNPEENAVLMSREC